MIVTTTPDIEGRGVSGYLGVVAAQGVLGVNVSKDVAAGMRNIFGGRSQSYENELAAGVSDSLVELEKQAAQLGADAVIGVDIDYESLGSQMLMISASGTGCEARTMILRWIDTSPRRLSSSSKRERCPRANGGGTPVPKKSGDGSRRGADPDAPRRIVGV